MEEVNAPQVSGMPAWMIKAFVAGVTAGVLIVIVRHWTSYEWFAKLTAVMLLALLGEIPVLATWGKKERKRFDWANLLPMYVVLLLATMLFGMRI